MEKQNALLENMSFQRRELTVLIKIDVI